MKKIKKKRRKKTKSIPVLFKFILILLLVILVFKLIKSNDSQLTSSEVSSQSSIEEKKEPISDTTISMSVIGDIMCHDSQYKDAYDSSTGKYDFSYVFSDVKDYLKNADITVGNLETTFAGKEAGYSNYPNFNTPEDLAYNLKDLGIDVVSTANNHSLDKRYNGLVSTLKFLDDAGIAHTGTYASPEDQNKILMQDVNGIKIAFLSFTYGTNGIPIPSGKEYCINIIDNDFIVKQIELAKKEEPDMICVFMHWGIEYVTKQIEAQEKLANLLFDNGVDVILGGHPHVLEPMEKRTITLPDGSTKDGFLIYSLGNFVSGQTKENTKTSAILNLTFTKKGETGKISVDSAKYVPVYMYRSSSGSTKRYKLLDTEKAISDYESGAKTSIGNTVYNNLKNALKLTKNILGEEIN